MNYQKGSFGAILKPVIQARSDYVSLQEKNPWRFLEPFHQYGVGRAAEHLSKLVGTIFIFLAHSKDAILPTWLSYLMRRLALQPYSILFL